MRRRGYAVGELGLPARRRAVDLERVAVRLPAAGRAAAPLAEVAAHRAQQAARAPGDAARRDLRGRRHLPGGPPLHPAPPPSATATSSSGPASSARSARTCPHEPVPGVRGAALSADDPVRGRVGPHRGQPALRRRAARPRPRRHRPRPRAHVRVRAHVPARHGGAGDERPAGAGRPAAARRRPPRRPLRPRRRSRPAPVAGPAAAGAGEALLQRALAATSSGVTIAGVRPARRAAAVRQRRLRAAVGLPGRTRCSAATAASCRARTPTRPRSTASARRSRPAQECRETLLNYRGPERTPWWNEIYLAPVNDEHGPGAAVHRGAERRHRAGRGRAGPGAGAATGRSSYLARIEQLAFTDPLTGLPNRRRVEDRVEAALLEARLPATPWPLLFLDLDGFKPINDRHGHAAGDERARRHGAAAQRPAAPHRPAGPPRRRRVPRRAARPGRGTARERAEQVAAELAHDVGLPVASEGSRPASASASA